ncbi:MAG: histidine triad (HIT) family protein [Natronomonas sp.]|jgi:histidine triad (HIT) family protein|uniref:HIT family protein n=1 Tax=Natronomonas sp. TaxID=2184060 RepID=UPI003989D391
MSDAASPECPFCRIGSGTQHAHRVHETDEVIAFLDTNPAVEGHTLVAPKAHVRDIVTAEPTAATAVFEALDVVADALGSVIEPEGFSVFHTSGPLVGRIEHAHVHLLPRSEDDDISLALRRTELDETAGVALAERLREAV